jgi:hypothetical protein
MGNPGKKMFRALSEEPSDEYNQQTRIFEGGRRLMLRCGAVEFFN